MKTFKFLLLTLLVIQLSACSNNDFNELVEHGKIQNSSIDTIQIDDEFDVYSYVEEHSELFGSPLIFNSFEDAENMVNSLNNMDYIELKDWCEQNNFSSMRIQSLICCDSLIDCLEYEILGKEIESLEEEDLVYEEFCDIIESPEYDDLFVKYEKFDSTINDMTFIVKPLGLFGDPYTILCNNQNLFIIDNKVFYYIENTLVSTDVQNFHIINEISSLDYLILLLSAGQLNEDQIEIHYCWSFFQEKKITKHFESSPRKYLISLDLHTRAYTGLLSRRVGGGFKITNEKYVSRKKTWIPYKSHINYSITFNTIDSMFGLYWNFNFLGETRKKVKSVSKCSSKPIVLPFTNLRMSDISAQISNDDVELLIP